MFLGNLVWDPDRFFFVFPYVNHPVTWYGLLFALSFLIGYLLFRKIFSKFLTNPTLTPLETKLLAIKLTDRLAFLVVLGTVIGARLGHVFFYGWPYYRQHPFDIIKVWEGGLASHGGAIGVLGALLIFVIWSRRCYRQLTFLTLLDMVVIPTPFIGGCIRIGNFINQEITGIPTTVPWAVIFMHPADGIAGIAVHPVQLYESIIYFAIFIFLYLLWLVRAHRIGYGLFSGYFFTLVFGSRFIMEFFKVPQSEWLSAYSPVKMGQLLSIPFILLGISLLIHYRFCKKNDSLSPS